MKDADASLHAKQGRYRHADTTFNAIHHVALNVQDLNRSEQWYARFDELGVTHSGVQQAPLTGSFPLAFRDRDDLALELYTAVGATAL